MFPKSGLILQHFSTVRQCVDNPTEGEQSGRIASYWTRVRQPRWTFKDIHNRPHLRLDIYIYIYIYNVTPPRKEKESGFAGSDAKENSRWNDFELICWCQMWTRILIFPTRSALLVLTDVDWTITCWCWQMLTGHDMLVLTDVDGTTTCWCWQMLMGRWYADVDRCDGAMSCWCWRMLTDVDGTMTCWCW